MEETDFVYEEPSLEINPITTTYSLGHPQKPNPSTVSGGTGEDFGI